MYEDVVVILGYKKVGKTLLLSPHYEEEHTYIYSLDIEMNCSKNKITFLEYGWSMSKDDKYLIRMKQAISKATAVVLMYDFDNKQSFNYLEVLCERLTKESPNILCGKLLLVVWSSDNEEIKNEEIHRNIELSNIFKEKSTYLVKFISSTT
jgi:hypothetical protein